MEIRKSEHFAPVLSDFKSKKTNLTKLTEMVWDKLGHTRGENIMSSFSYDRFQQVILRCLQRKLWEFFGNRFLVITTLNKLNKVDRDGLEYFGSYWKRKYLVKFFESPFPTSNPALPEYKFMGFVLQ